MEGEDEQAKHEAEHAKTTHTEHTQEHTHTQSKGKRRQDSEYSVV